MKNAFIMTAAWLAFTTLNLEYATAQNNTIQINSAYAFIGSGSDNIIQYNCSPSVIAGGSGNTIQTNSYYASIGGEDGNYIEPDSSYSVIGGAEDNTIGTGSPYSVIAGGDVNFIQPGSAYSVIVGGAGNIVGPNASSSLAAGSYAETLHAGSFVWSDASSSRYTTSIAANSWTVRATGGARFITAVDGSGTPTAGVSLAAGSGTWTSLSDRNAKEHFADVDAKNILAKVAALPVLTWNYKTQDASIRHIGPMAQDFKAAFKVGESDTGITTVDEEGVALAAIQGLNQKLNDKDVEIRQLQESVEQLKQLVQSLNGKK